MRSPPPCGRHFLTLAVPSDSGHAAMGPVDRFSLLLVHPAVATADLFDDPALGHAFAIVSAYAVVSGLHVTISSIVISEVQFLMSSFLLSVLGTYSQWIVLTLLLRGAASVVGGSGVLLKALGYTGLAAAPMIVISLASTAALLVVPLVIEGNARELLISINLMLTLVGMAWGWPGMLCYYGLRNGELLESHKAILIVVLMFVLLAGYMLWNAGAFS